MNQRIRPGSSLGAAICFAALALLYSPSLTDADSERPLLAESDRVPVLVALEAYRTSQGGSKKAEAAWLHRLVSRLERGEGAYDPLRVVDRFVLERDLVAYAAAAEDEARLREVARQADAEFVLYGSLTRLADRYSLDLRLLDVDRTDPIAHKVFEGEGVDGLAAAVDRAAGAARHWIANPSRQPPQPQVAFDPMANPVGVSRGSAALPERPPTARRPLEVASGEEGSAEPTVVTVPEPLLEADPDTVDEAPEAVSEPAGATAPPNNTPEGGHEVGRRPGSAAEPRDTPERSDGAASGFEVFPPPVATWASAGALELSVPTASATHAPTRILAASRPRPLHRRSPPFMSRSLPQVCYRR